MPNMRPVRVELSYENRKGVPINPPGLPKNMELPGYFFAEQVTTKVIFTALLQQTGIKPPDGISIIWTTIDDLPEGILH